jgi:4-hydroxy-4-methyl-2-oxoglutarate aldolase
MGQVGDIIVVDAGGDSNASVCGCLIGGLVMNWGIWAMIVRGADRYTDELEKIKWPIWVSAVTPRGAHTMFSGCIEELSTKVPIQCDSTIVSPVDLIVADLMGVTVIPLATAEGVVEKAREQGVREVATREWVNKEIPLKIC